MDLRQKLKIFLESIGLLKPARFVLRGAHFGVHCLDTIQDFFIAFSLYFYNDWLTNFPNNQLRIFYLKHVLGIKIGKSCFIHMGARFRGNIQIGNNSIIGRNCILIGHITIRNNVSITAETYIFATSHFIDSPTFACFYKEVVINDYAWIGARAMILPGVQIGKGAVLGAASTATKDIPDYSIFAGAPAKEIGKRTLIPDYTLTYFPFFQ